MATGARAAKSGGKRTTEAVAFGNRTNGKWPVHIQPESTGLAEHIQEPAIGKRVSFYGSVCAVNQTDSHSTKRSGFPSETGIAVVKGEIVAAGQNPANTIINKGNFNVLLILLLRGDMLLERA